MTVHRASPRLPAGVVLAAALALAAGVGAVAAGIWMFLHREDLSAAWDLGLRPEQRGAAGALAVALGAVLVLAAVGLVRRSRFMRGLFGLITAAGLAVATYGAVAGDPSLRTSSLAGVGLALLVLYLLFGSSRSQVWFDAA